MSSDHRFADEVVEIVLDGTAESSAVSPQPGITVSARALAELREAIDGASQFLRIWVETGGCSGMTYGAGIDDDPKESDVVVFEDGGFRIQVDPVTLQYIDGLEIDYSDDLVASGFRFRNPNATKACGCGASFGT